jgi:hypothetical protein
MLEDLDYAYRVEQFWAVSLCANGAQRACCGFLSCIHDMLCQLACKSDESTLSLKVFAFRSVAFVGQL